MNLFPESLPPKPLAERMRPTSLDDVLGQQEAKSLLSGFIEHGSTPHLIFFGPPGTGKTTMSRLIASLLEWEGRSLNATSASVKDIRALADEARIRWAQYNQRYLVFIDEIHRLNKGQQDVLLPILEAGTFTLAGSTTENPFFALNQALRSRVQLIRLEPLSLDDLLAGLVKAAAALEVEAELDALEWIAQRVGGDLRLAYTTLESAALAAGGDPIGLELAARCLGRTQVSGDRKGDNHYDLASAFQKSLRGSDANAAIYYLARFLETGEDPRFIARRLLVTAAEDVGNADPQALLIANAAFRAVEVIGLPEARIHLSQAVIYIANAPKSNQSVVAVGNASTYIKENPLDPIPAHLRDSHYAGAEQLGHGKGYVYSHNNPEQSQNFLPEKALGQQFVPAARPKEQTSKHKPETEFAILKHLEQRKGEWFELEAEPLAEALDIPVGEIRSALNSLVLQKKLGFKRLFTLQD